MSTLIRPMKAIAVERIKLSYGNCLPLLEYWYASGKIDGLRCTVQHSPDGPRAYTNSLKLHTNKFVQDYLSNEALVGLDGELVVDGNFHRCSGELRRRDGKPDFTFWVFDILDKTLPFKDRLPLMRERVRDAGLDRVKVLNHYKLTHERNVEVLNTYFVHQGFEGVCVRDGNALYKEDRSSAAQPECLKIKMFKESTGTIVGWDWLARNLNEPTRNAVGLLTRSSAREGKVAEIGTLGSLTVKSPDFLETFQLGSGFTANERRLLGKSPQDLVGLEVRFKYQQHGSTADRPRSPIFVSM